ncbi:MAG: PIN domain-containing protein [Thermodesulfovibrionales bacterium]|nr:PIN domain-containing protein [Thermodesulfovibrionales bacterium]
MKKAFFDTWAWVAIAHEDDNHHKEANSFYKKFLISKGLPVTTDYVLAETITLLRARLDFGDAEVFMDTLILAAKEGKIMLERIDDRRWTKAWEMSKKYHDKPYISFFDFTSFVVMKEVNVLDVLTADKHFEDIGMGFRKLF